jgi:hypothetical protein
VAFPIFAEKFLDLSNSGQFRLGKAALSCLGVRWQRTPRHLSRQMTKTFATAMAAATLLAVSLAATPGNAQDAARHDLRLAQGFDIQIGRDHDDGYRRRRSDTDATVGIGTSGITVGPRRRENCRMVTTRIERDDGRITTRRTGRCD